MINEKQTRFEDLQGTGGALCGRSLAQVSSTHSKKPQKCEGQWSCDYGHAQTEDNPPSPRPLRTPDGSLGRQGDSNVPPPRFFSHVLVQYVRTLLFARRMLRQSVHTPFFFLRFSHFRGLRHVVLNPTN